jgi:hypothetical protein
MTPQQQAECIDLIVKASRANAKPLAPPVKIDPAKYDLRNYPEARAFLRGAHAMNAAAELERQAAKADAIALLTLLQETTQSRSVAERCEKAKAVLS